MGKSRKTTVPKGKRYEANGSAPERSSRSRSAAKEQPLPDVATDREKQAFMRAIVVGCADLEAGRELAFIEAKARLGLKSR
jgi:hypothetical protein